MGPSGELFFSNASVLLAEKRARIATIIKKPKSIQYTLSIYFFCSAK
jgi:hypothetical protein